MKSREGGNTRRRESETMRARRSTFNVWCGNLEDVNGKQKKTGCDIDFLRNRITTTHEIKRLKMNERKKMIFEDKN